MTFGFVDRRSIRLSYWRATKKVTREGPGTVRYGGETSCLVVETDDIAKLHAFLKPGAGVTTAEITPVSDTPVA